LAAPVILNENEKEAGRSKNAEKAKKVENSPTEVKRGLGSGTILFP
jgi:hypothetical protein